MKFRVFNVRYDTDGEMVPLPQELTLELSDHEDVEDELSELVSDLTGFCHHGFEYEVLD